MTWNLRLVKMESEEYPDEKYIEIREVYYDQIGKPLGHSAATMGGENKDEIEQYLVWAVEALNKPILNFGEDK
jgi:hypothetical protein